MTITKADVKLLASQVMTDNSDGGGSITGNEIIDGQVNNIFTDISRLDRTIGRFSLRKVFAAVLTDTTETYFGSHIVLTDPPDDDNVHVTLFSTDSPTDQRSQAQNAVESYVIRSVLSRWTTYGIQAQGQKLILAFSQLSADLPEIGQVLNLVENEGQLDEFDQFVRVTNVEASVQTFTDANGDFQVRVLTITISDGLRSTFNGTLPTRTDTQAPAIIKKTSVADITKYYGVKKLAQDAQVGDFTITVESVYTNLVPSSQGESALADIPASGLTEVGSFYDNSGRVEIPYSEFNTIGDTFTFPGGNLIPGKVKFDLITPGVSNRVYRDDGNGVFISTTEGSANEGTVYSNHFYIDDYEAGIIRHNFGFSGTKEYFVENANVIPYSDIGQTDFIAVTAANRATTYVKTLSPIPAPGSLVIDYKALDNWIRLVDTGNGVLEGEQPGTGSATINFATGTVIMTLAALPDVDSSILFGWGTGVHYTDRSGQAEIQQPVIEYTVPEGAILPNSLTLTWTSDSIVQTATDDGSGNITGDGTGEVSYSTGRFYIKPNVSDALPDPTSNLIVDYDHTAVISETFTPTETSGFIDFTLTQTPIKPQSVKITFTTKVTDTVRVNYPPASQYELGATF